MYPQEDKNTKGNLWAALATALYLALVALLLLTIYFTFRDPPRDEQIVLDLGGMSGAGIGKQGGHPSLEPAAKRQPIEAVRSSNQPTLTQDYEPAPAVKPHSSRTPATTEPTTATIPPPTEKPRQVDQQSLFRNPTPSSTPSGVASVGSGSGTGGPDGGTGSSGTGPGSGISGIFELEGRALVGKLPKPDYSANENGRVVVAITVDGSGVVIAAAFSPMGSTTQNPTLVGEAVKAARKARFTPSGNGDQKGTITYKFTLE